MNFTLCKADEIPEGTARGFELSGRYVVAIKKSGQIFLYLNRCPHLGMPLEWEPDDFMDKDGRYIRCANHGAFFVPESGECVQGPCQGESLRSIEFQLLEGNISIAEEDLPAVP